VAESNSSGKSAETGSGRAAVLFILGCPVMESPMAFEGGPRGRMMGSTHQTDISLSSFCGAG